MDQSWSVVIFGFNEGKTIADVIGKAKSFFEINKVSAELIIIDDGSTDETELTVTEFISDKVIYIRHSSNLGIGPALLSGYNKAVKENLIAIPADGQFDINELKPFLNFPENKFISFYRQELKEYSAYRKIISFLNKCFNRFFLDLNIKDVNWVKAYKTKDLKTFDLELKSSLIASEICGKLIIKNLKPIETSSVYHSRKAGVARGASLSNLLDAVKELSKLVYIIRKFKKSQTEN
jgi:glycosyltransferase involved in cell wall biosynthesis